MNLKPFKPQKVINKAFLKIKPNRTEIENFKTNLTQLLDRTNDIESEEFHKNLVIDFLKKTYYEPNHFVNTKGRNDLVIHNGNKAKSTVGVIIEAKKPTNKAEMLTISKINVKAFQELVLYYLRERITNKNLEIKYLVATNINEWFIFDEHLFEKVFAQNTQFVKQFQAFEAGKKSTSVFYKEIAKPFIAALKEDIEFTYFDIRKYEKLLRTHNPVEDNKLISLFKLLSPEHLLKKPFANDSNSLDKRFYGELLHIIGLSETKQGGKKLIKRNKKGERNTGSLLENAIIQLDSLDKINRLENPSRFGINQEERLFTIGLELSITWINRILFLKLLEAQLKTYHKGDKSYEFLNIDKIQNYDDLNSLFFQVLAKKQAERNQDVATLFAKVPYLNSSLFEPTEIEHETLVISNLRHDKTIPIYASSVLKSEKGKKRTGNLSTLEYLFEFLNAYDFSSEGSEAIQEDNKTLINASVLGLIFEKINGYKDGSFFTPGFITMYMCSQTIRKAVVQKFNETKNWNCKDFSELKEDLQENIKAGNRKDIRKEANSIINSLKICDPAVGSGHFLVSALNELIVIKDELKILVDRNFEPISTHKLEIANDELVITNLDDELFEYNPKHKESQGIQEALFHEKQTLIENCLFGVDINPNSVKICQLRLWIELLKNAYYKTEVLPSGLRALETFPNIDINIKCGNSLISRFELDTDIKKALKSSKWTIDKYRNAVNTYRNAKNKTQKRAMEKLIADIKNNFRSEIAKNDPKIKKLNKLQGEILLTNNQSQIFDLSRKEKTAQNKKLKQLTAAYKKLKIVIEEIKNNKIYEDAFEWRFEFPEVLDDNGNFVGFDAVIGNPPYLGEKGHKDLFRAIRQGNLSRFYQRKMDIFYFFFHLGLSILKENGSLSFITTNYFLTSDGGEILRTDLKNRSIVNGLINLNELKIFESAKGQHNIITFLNKGSNINSPAINLLTSETGECNEDLFKKVILAENNKSQIFKISQSELYETNGNYIRLEGVSDKDNPTDIDSIFNKIIEQGTPLIQMCDISQGILSGVDRISKKHIVKKLTTNKNINAGVFVLTNDEIKSKELAEKELDLIKPWFKNSDINKYFTSKESKYKVIYATRDVKIENYPVIQKHLEKFKRVIKNRSQDRGEMQAALKLGKWWVIFAARTRSVFEGEKIVCPQRTKTNVFGYNNDIWYSSADVYYITKPSGDVKLKYILALLNSKLYYYWLYHKGKRKGEHLELYYTPLTQIPIKKINKRQQQPFIDLVDEILKLKEENPKADTTVLENEIDQLVYKLYDLSEEEIKIIEKANA